MSDIVEAALTLVRGKSGKALALAIEQVLALDGLFAFGELLQLEVHARTDCVYSGVMNHVGFSCDVCVRNVVRL